MIERTIKIDKITPEELAKEFCDMFADEQARFFARVWNIAKDWPGSGWCGQSYAIIKEAERAEPGLCPNHALSAIETLASHLPDDARRRVAHDD